MTIWESADDGFADLGSHDAFLTGPPLNTFARMRAQDPLAWSDWNGGEGYWSITRHSDIFKLNSQTDLLSSARGIRMEDQSYEEYVARRTFQETDGHDHRQVRMKVAKAFSAPVIANFENQIKQLCSDILDQALPLQTFDATKLIARELPMRMLGQILGAPEKDLPWLVEKGDALIANTDPDFTDHVLDKMKTDEYRMMPFNSPAGAELYDYARELMHEKAKAGDTDGVLHLILQPDENGESMPEQEFRNFFCLLVAAGNDTTRYSIAAGIMAMCRQSQLLQQMQQDANVWNTAPDEIIRWACPTNYFRRTAMKDFEMHGKKVREGDKVLYWFFSGNRDENAFENPAQLNLHRKPNRHLSFGQGGPHLCLGMHLARLEVRVLFQELSARINSIELAGEHRFLRSNFISGIKQLPVSVTLK